jgi:MFS family permease|uniref:MFS transporter n=1 Tax=Sphingomonas sp. TaxID=28214 RepID=UPI00356708A3
MPAKAEGKHVPKILGALDSRSITKIALTSSAGAAVEWYDFFIYGTAAALVFPQLFFPATLPPFVAQIAAFATFAIGFIARPLGGILFGHFGDLLGRKRALVFALMLMGLSTALIGTLPTGIIRALAPTTELSSSSRD